MEKKNLNLVFCAHIGILIKNHDIYIALSFTIYKGKIILMKYDNSIWTIYLGLISNYWQLGLNFLI